MAKDYYGILGVGKDASEGEIKTAYRNMAKKYHPDMNPNNAQAADKFKECNEAYEVLSDSEKRGRYDRGEMDFDGSNGAGGFGGGFSGFGGGFEDIFDMFTNAMGGGRGGRQARQATGTDITYSINLSFMEAALGVSKEINISRVEKCPTCNGSGAKDANSVKTCDKCNGTGTATYYKDTFLGRQVVQQSCDKCGGSGKIVTDNCRDCSGKGLISKKKIVTITIPAGVDNGTVLTISGEGNACKVYNGRSGNLQLVVNVADSKVFKRDDVNLYVDIPVSVFVAALGGEIEVPTLSGKTVYKLGEGTANNEVIRFRNKGIRNSRGRTGDLFATIIVEVPKGLSKQGKQALEELERQTNLRNYPKRNDYNNNIENLYKK